MMAEIIQMPKNPCPFCKKNEATRLCDFVIDYAWTSMKDEYGQLFGPIHVTCSNPICEGCRKRIGGYDICPLCMPLYEFIQKNHVVKRK